MPSGGKREGAGRKPWKPTEKDRLRVAAGIAMSMSVEEIRLGIINPKTGKPFDPKTFRAAFPDEIEMAKASFLLELATGLVQDMRDGKANTTRIFLAKARLGLRETSRHEHTGADGGAITYEERLQKLHNAGPADT